MADAVAVDKSVTSEKANVQGKECTLGQFISESDGWKIVEVAATWEGTPYSLVGGNSVKGRGGDCSGTTNKSFVEAGFPYPYQSTANFASYANASHRFREINVKKEPMQAGDLLLWPGHMAIYAPFPAGHPKYDTGVMKHGQKKFNNMYTAFNATRGVPYGPYNIETFRGDAYRVFRYLLLPNATDCKK
jgi:hypothetical protein